MRILFVFDDYLMVNRLSRLFGPGDTVYLFSMTSKLCIKNAIIDRIKCNGCDIRLLQSAQLINASAENLRGQYIRFIADFPERVRSKGRNLKELFAVDGYISLWWFSLLAEKNIFKTDSFNRLAQLESIVRVIKREKIDKIMIGCRTEKLKDALSGYSRKNRIQFEILPRIPIRGLRMRFREFQKLLYLKHNMHLIYSLICALFRTHAIRRQISPLQRIIPQNDNSLLFFTPFPNIDESSARNGIFKNKFYPHLQEALERSKRNIIWVAMYARHTNISFEKSMEYAKRFIKNSYIIFFLEEFNSLSAQIKALLTILKSGFRFLMLERNIATAHDFRDYNVYPLFKDDWYSSFVGKTGYLGVVYYYMFRNLFKKIKAEKCLYFYEMRLWEKALISARDALGIKTSLFGYQSSTVSKMYLNFFNHPSEVSDRRRYSIPRPDKIVCNGRLPYLYIKESGWPEEKFSIVEALRYGYLRKYLNSPSVGKKQNIVLLTFSFNPEESSSILTIVDAALKGLKNGEVWVKPHPFLDFEKVIRLSGMSKEDFSFKLKQGPIEDFLLEARIVIAGESSVAVEALAFGCEAVIVNVPEWINMSPLRFINTEIIKTVYSPKELRETVINIFDKEYKPEAHTAEARRIINNFFFLNQDTDVPESFLKLLVGANG